MLSLYMMTTFKSPSQKSGKGIYILEAITSKGPATVTKKEEFEELTENRVNLMMYLEAVKRIKTPSEVTLYTDSNYLVSGFMEWSEKWQRNQWTNGKGQEIKNADLWKEALTLNKAKGIVLSATTRPHSFTSWMESELHEQRKRVL